MIPSGQLRELLSKLFHDPREPLRTIQVSLELLQMRSERIADPLLIKATMTDVLKKHRSAGPASDQEIE